jgi:DNA-directed RNA polymerase subunit beta'
MKNTEQHHMMYTPDTISLSLASPERVRDWSYGEIQKPETINYRTGRSERGGLFDERVFGPEKDYECYCGKYKRIRYAGIICEKCGVEVTRSIVRRERMGHIELASPVAHIWFLRAIPSRLSLLLDVPVSNLEKVVYFAGYIITEVHDTERQKVMKELEHEYKVRMKTLEKDSDKDAMQELFTATKKEIMEIVPNRVLTEIEYHRFSVRYGTVFEAGIGGEAVYSILKNLDLKKMESELEKIIEKKSETVAREKIEKRLQLVRSFLVSGQRPEWMFLKAIPVIPPALRPMVPLEGGRFATSDVNDLYRRVINRNNRLKKLKEIGAPDVILRNEKRILQEAVDSLIDNTIRKSSGSVAMNQSQKRQLKSLADYLKGKQGIFRANLLGKRVDYSGRSVIVVGPNLKLNECGIPKYMALELFRPFVISEVIKRELAFNIRGAGKLIEEGIPEVWEILEQVIKGKYVMLNRAPTLHRLSIQAFHPVLIEGKAIQIHPLVCSAFNADFDGDQMAVHVPLSQAAQIEARDLIASNKNLLKPQSGDPVTAPSQDIVLGVYWLTKIVPGKVGEGKYFTDPAAAILSHSYGLIDLRAKIFVAPDQSERYAAFAGTMIETSVGRILFNQILPENYPFINEIINKKGLSNIVDTMINNYGIDATPEILDAIKSFGYKYATMSGTSMGIDDAIVPEAKKAQIEEGKNNERKIIDQYMDGLISDEERYIKLIELWEGITRKIEKEIQLNFESSESIADIAVSGARGSIGQLTQMAGMKGVIVNTQGRPIDFPVISSYKEGLSPIEYFITNHGSRKGLADTALNTANAGYLTRKLIMASQDVVITETDCGGKKGLVLREETIDGIVKPITKHLFGRVLAEPLKNDQGEVIFKKGHMITKTDMKIIEKQRVPEAVVRSPLSCETVYGLCQQCYGLDLGRNDLVKFGEAVGIVSAQAIGEPGTQLTLRTIHSGGVVGASDITAGLPRVTQLLECSTAKFPATVSRVNGEVVDIRVDGETKIVQILADADSVKNGEKNHEYVITIPRSVIVKKGMHVRKGDLLTDGSADVHEMYDVAGFDRVQEYLIAEISRVYELNSSPVSRKHLEIIVRQMFSRRRIITPNGTRFTTGQIIENVEFVKENERAVADGELPATAKTILIGISQVSLTSKSWMSAAAFERTTSTLVNKAIQGGTDEFRGLMENVMIGNLIPAGTGLSEDFIPEVAKLKKEEDALSAP